MQDRILVIGGAQMDFTMHVRNLPAAGESTIEEGRFGYAAGGSGALAALAIRRLGGDAVFAGRVGADVHGSRLLRLYADTGLDTSYVQTDRRYPTGMRILIQEDNGNSRSVFYPGANGNVVAGDAERAIENASPTALYLQADLAPDTLIAASRRASLSRHSARRRSSPLTTRTPMP